MFSDLTVRDLLDRFSSSDPTPGGGSAAALAGALGASLLAMVAGMTKTKTGTPEERAALDAARADLLRHRQMLIDLIDRDAQAYDLVVAAYRRPKGTDEEKAARTGAIQDAMRVAAETPLETIRVCAETMTAARPVQAFGNRAALSDIAVGIALLGSGMHGGMMNVAVNLDGIKDEAQRRSLAERTLALMRTVHERAGAEAPAEIGELMKGLMQYAGMPDPASTSTQYGALAVQGLLRLGSAEARTALEALAQSADAAVAKLAQDALTRFGQ